MIGLVHKSVYSTLFFLLLFVISGAADAYETDTVQFNATLGLGEYGFDTGYLGYNEALARMQVRAYGTLGLNLADVTMNGNAQVDSGVIGVIGTTDGGNFSFSLGLEYGAYAYYGIPVLGLDEELDLLTLFGLESKNLLLDDSRTFTPFLLDSSIHISDSSPPEKFGDFDVTNFLFPGIPFVGAGVTLDLDMELQENLSGERIYFSNPGSSIDTEGGTLAFSGSSTILSYYEDADAEVIVGLWPGLYVDAFGWRFDLPIARIPVSVYSSNLPLPFNNSAVNFSGSVTSSITVNASSDDTSIEPYQTITISGTATYNTGVGVDGTATINSGGTVYTAAVINGIIQDRSVTGPSSSGNVTVTVSDGTLSDSDSIYISVSGDGGTNNYDLETYVAYDIQDEGNGYCSYSYKDVYTTSDYAVNGLFIIDNANLSSDLDFKLKFYYPDGSQYGGDLEELNAFSSSWEWGYWWWGYLISGSSMAYNPGEYKVRFYVDNDRKATKYYVVGWNFVKHKMCKSADSGDPWMYHDPTNVFSPEDTRAVAWHEFEDVGQEIYVKTSYYAPDGSLYLAGSEHLCEFNLPQDHWYDWYRYYQPMTIKGAAPEFMCGDWTVRFYVKNPSSGAWEQQYTDIFRIVENTAPTVTSISASPSSPIETQSVTVDTSASDNNHLKKLVLHWNDGTDHTQTWDNINSGSTSKSHNIGSFSSGTSVEYWAEVWDESGNRSESDHNTVVVSQETVTNPNKPAGDAFLQVGESTSYTTGGSITSLGHPVEYEFDWDDSTLSGYGSATQGKSWSSEGYYFVRAHAHCQTHTNRESLWSTPFSVTVESTNPTVEITTNGGADFETDQSQVIILGTATDSGVTSGLVSVSINTGAPNEGTLSDWQFTVDLVEGTNPLIITATDNAGNIGTDTIIVTYNSSILITATAGPNGTIDPSGDVDVNPGENQLFTAYPNLGYTVDEWLLDGEPNQIGGTIYTLYNIQTAHTVHVEFRVGPVIYVDDDSPNDPGTGTQLDPFRRIQNAIDSALNGDEVRVAAGTYERITAKDAVNLYGGYNSINWDAPRDPNANKTVVDGQWDSPVVAIIDANIIIDGFVIQNGYGDYSGQYGGGIHCASNTASRFGVTISNNVIQDNWLPRGNGAGIYCDSNVECVIIDNVVQNNKIEEMDINTANGGGIYCGSTSAHIVRNTIIDNKIDSLYGEYHFYSAAGGGIWVAGGLVMDNTVLRNSVRAAGHWGGQHRVKGGGIYCDGPTTITRNIVEDNELLCQGGEASGGDTSEAYGGGIYAPNSDITLNIVRGNTCHANGCWGVLCPWQLGDDGAGGMAHGGGIYSPTAVITGNLVVDNSAIAEGGSGDYGTGTGGNGIAKAGGIYAPGTIVTNNTVSNNNASGIAGSGSLDGASIVNAGGISADSNSIIANTIVWGNSPDQISGHDCSNVSYCVIGDAVCNGLNGNISTNPLFVDPNNGDYHLLSASPCIDAGDSNSVPLDITIDLDGRPRIVDGDCDSTATVDMGVYEFDWLYVGGFEGDDCDVDLGDFSVLAQNFQLDNPAIDIAPYLDPDGIIDFKELLILSRHWLEGTGP